MKKQVNKTKITKKIKRVTKKQKRKQENTSIYFGIILTIILAPILVIILVYFFKADRIQKEYYPRDSKDVKILTDKNIYSLSDKIVLIVKNYSGESIYFEPCEYLNTFEKKINGEWEKEDTTINNGKYYNQVSFNKNKSITKCEIKLPESGEGIYRSAIEIYYNCSKPGNCENSEIFYSNEFEIE